MGGVRAHSGSGRPDPLRNPQGFERDNVVVALTHVVQGGGGAGFGPECCLWERGVGHAAVITADACVCGAGGGRCRLSCLATSRQLATRRGRGVLTWRPVGCCQGRGARGRDLKKGENWGTAAHSRASTELSAAACLHCISRERRVQWWRLCSSAEDEIGERTGIKGVQGAHQMEM